MRASVDAAHRRRAAHGPEDDLGRFPDLDDLWGVDDYLSRYQRVPDPVLRQDGATQILILDYLAAELDRRRLRAVRLLRKKGTTWRALAALLGVTSAQGAEQTALRLVNAVEGEGQKDEKEGRRYLRATQAPESPLPVGREPMIRGFIALLIEHRDELSDSVLESVYMLKLPRNEPIKASFEMEVRWVIEEIVDEGIPPSLGPAVAQVAEVLRVE